MIHNHILKYNIVKVNLHNVTVTLWSWGSSLKAFKRNSGKNTKEDDSDVNAGYLIHKREAQNVN
jgi:hypothetical protein